MRFFFFASSVAAMATLTVLAACSGSSGNDITSSNPTQPSGSSTSSSSGGGSSSGKPSSSSSSSTSSSGGSTSSSSSSSSSSGGSTSSSSSSSSSSGGVMCNALVQQGLPVGLVSSNATAPVPLGGSIPDGTYVFTSASLYGSSTPPGETLYTLDAITIELKGMNAETVDTSAMSGLVTRTSGAFTTVPPHSLLGTTSCTYPATDAGSGSPSDYTASATGFSLITTSSSETIELVFTKK